MQFPCAGTPARICRCALGDYVIYSNRTNLLLFLQIVSSASERNIACCAQIAFLQPYCRSSSDAFDVPHSSIWMPDDFRWHIIFSALTAIHIHSCNGFLFVTSCAHVSTKWKYQWSLEQKMRNNGYREEVVDWLTAPFHFFDFIVSRFQLPQIRFNKTWNSGARTIPNSEKNEFLVGATYFTVELSNRTTDRLNLARGWPFFETELIRTYFGLNKSHLNSSHVRCSDVSRQQSRTWSKRDYKPY